MSHSNILALKQKAIYIDALQKGSQHIISHYTNLHLGNKSIPVPYYINRADSVPCRPEEIYKTRKSLHRELLAKGNPNEIENIVKKYASKYKFSLENASVKEIQEFMFYHGLGIDCSGFVVWVLNEYTKLTYNKNFWQCIKISANNIFKKLNIYLRPVENISVQTFKENATKITNLNDVLAGDILITRPNKTDNHIILITEVGFDQHRTPIYIDYIQAADRYSYLNGIITGTIVIKDKNKYLVDQEWIQNWEGENHTFNGVRNDVNAAQIMRINYSE